MVHLVRIRKTIHLIPCQVHVVKACSIYTVRGLAAACQHSSCLAGKLALRAIKLTRLRPFVPAPDPRTSISSPPGSSRYAGASDLAVARTDGCSRNVRI